MPPSRSKVTLPPWLGSTEAATVMAEASPEMEAGRLFEPEAVNRPATVGALPPVWSDSEKAEINPLAIWSSWLP